MRRGLSRVLREARTEVPLLCCLAALIAVLAGAAGAAPPLLDRLAGRALADRIETAQAEKPLLVRRASFGRPLQVRPGERSSPVADAIDLAEHDLTAAVPDALDDVVRTPEHQVLVPAARLTAPRGPAALSLLHTTLAPGPAAYAAGRPPRGTGRDGPVELAVSTRTRDALGLELGDRLRLTPRVAAIDSPAVVSGFFRTDPTGPGARLRHGHPLLAAPLDDGTGPPEAQALIAPAALDALLDRGLPSVDVEWRLGLRFDTAATARFAGDDGRKALVRALAAYERAANANFCASAVQPFCVYGIHRASAPHRVDDLQPLVADFGAEWRQAATVVSFAVASLVGVGLAAAVVVARLAVRRRLGEHRLQRARGASAVGVASARAGRSAPAAALGLAGGLGAARLAVPAGFGPPPVWAGTAVAVAAWLVLPALTWAAVRDRRLRRDEPEDERRGREPGARRHTGRRVTVEAAVVLLAAAGVVALRVRGTAGTAGADPLLAAVPVLCGLAAVVLLVRLYPGPLRLLARLAARRRGPLALLALSRAARDAPAAVLALLVLVTTLATAVFGGLVGSTVEEGRRTALTWETGGADAVLTDARRPGAAEALRAAPGVAHTVRTRLIRTGLTSVDTGLGHAAADLLAADAAALRRAAPDSPAAAALAGVSGTTTGPRGDGRVVLPVLANGALDGARTGATYETELPGVDVRVVGRLDDPALRDPAFGPLLAARDELPGAARPVLLADTTTLTTAEREARPQDTETSDATRAVDAATGGVSGPGGVVSAAGIPGFVGRAATADGAAAFGAAVRPDATFAVDAATGGASGPGGVVPAAGTPATGIDAGLPAAGDAATLLYGARLDGAALRTAAPATGPGSPYGQLRITAEEAAADRDDGVLGAIRGAHAVCGALAAALALLALVAELLLSAPERARTTAYLRVLGLGRRGATALGALQLLPLAVAAAAGGTALGLALPVALGPALDLHPLTGGPAPPALHTDQLLTAALTAGLLALVAAATAADAITTRRRAQRAALRLGADR